MNNYNDIRKFIIKSQHVQRCWDLTKSIPDDDIDLLVFAATNCPSKQNFKFYKLHVITNRKIIEKIHAMTTGGFTKAGETTTNSQTLANLLFVFEDIELSEQYKKHWVDRDNSLEWITRRDADMAIGVAAGYINMLSTMLGYSTGFCACFDSKEVSDELGLNNNVRLILGVGYSDTTRDRRTHHVTDQMMVRKIKEAIEVQFYR